MLKSTDLWPYCVYRAKIFEGAPSGPNNDRTIIHIDFKAQTVMFDSDLPGEYDSRHNLDSDRLLPVVSIEKFLAWAEKELTEKEFLLYYPNRKGGA